MGDVRGSFSDRFGTIFENSEIQNSFSLTGFRDYYYYPWGLGWASDNARSLKKHPTGPKPFPRFMPYGTWDTANPPTARRWRQVASTRAPMAHDWRSKLVPGRLRRIATSHNTSATHANVSNRYNRHLVNSTGVRKHRPARQRHTTGEPGPSTTAHITLSRNDIVT